ncbi:J domain-containing protein [Anabaena sp. FACHB-1237]|uniref:DnaJ domain-containing protein n=1 Tax=Anabaena sp. FACHB-1237 TaxID=2692769 RepID=UPI0016811590|nr:J domain-containing protein [Anabaena sp. FACHB-1237]MBD2138045.1 J domain-containing protein [Anabaena sp. FACHB-1237]
MSESNHYQTLNVTHNATQAEIKQAYRRLVKIFHPDTNQDTANHDKIILINAAYEVLSDTQRRINYDQELRLSSQKFHYSRQERTVSAQQSYHKKRKIAKDTDEKVEEWMRVIYKPVNRILCVILNSLEEEIEDLAADPFDDELIEEFQEYLTACRDDLKKAQNIFRSLPNPPSLAKAAAHLYYSLGQVADGLQELEYFPLNYDDRYLHTGQEMFRIAMRLHCEAQESVS